MDGQGRGKREGFSFCHSPSSPLLLSFLAPSIIWPVHFNLQQFNKKGMHWKLTTALVCLFGVLRKFRPGTPFLTPYLESPDFKNFTNQQVYGEIYTFWTYSSLISMVPIFALIDPLRYKPFLVLEAVSLLATWLLLIYGTSLWHMQLMQICFGIASSADVAYYSYLYAVVSKKHYRRTTSYIRTASMLGKFLAYSLGQLLISTELGDYLLLNQLTLAPAILLVPISLILPFAQRKKEVKPGTTKEAGELEKDEHSELLDGVAKAGTTVEKSSTDEELVDTVQLKICHRKCGFVGNALELMERDFFAHYRNRHVFRWSLWSVLLQCAIFQIMNYVQTLWAHRRVEKAQIWNGLVESVNTLLAAFAVFLVQFLPLNWEKHEFAFFGLTSTAMAALVLASVHWANIFVDYAAYCLLYALFNVSMAISSNLIATHLSSHFYGFVFGLNTFCTAVAQTLLTFLVADSAGTFHLPIEQQFTVYGAFFIGMGLLFAVLEVPALFRRFCLF